MTRTPALLLLLGLAGCPWIDRGEWSSVQDADGDQVLDDRFGGPDCRPDDPDIAYCDFDQDGFDAVEVGGDDCDDHDASVRPDTVFWSDADGDGFGDPSRSTEACVPPAGTVVPVTGLEDCDDGRRDVHPGADELCDDIDQNCDGDATGGADGDLFYVDEDHDGYGSTLSTVAGCTPGEGYAVRGDDCDDQDGDVHPGATETWYDGVDADCDGWADDDQDHDGEGATAAGGPDCDDLDPERNTAADERCNGVDDDCDLRADDQDDDADQIDQIAVWQDGDRDGYGSLVTATFCPNALPDGWTVLSGDCRDDLPSVHPGGTERCNRIDDDCNNLVDDGTPVGAVTVYADGDDDGWGDTTASTLGCEPGPDETLLGGDCNDGDPATYPGAAEVCGDAVRQDCSTTLSPMDCDGDGSATDDPDPDCLDDPTDPHALVVHPGYPEVCDGVDNDCNGLTDGADPGADRSTASDWYVDLDHDGYGSTFLAAQRCTPPPDAVPNDLDCDDTDGARNPSAPESCNTVDDDCDGQVDEAATVGLTTYYQDLDEDGFGAPGTARGSCSAPGATWIAVAGDCDDTSALAHPGAAESCNAVDDDCDGRVDAADPNLVGPIWYADADQDGWGLQSDAVGSCTQVPGRSLTPGDCDDARDDRNPGRDEVCDGGLDNDCDGLADDADPDLASVTTFFRDADLDGFGDAGTTAHQCGQPPGYVTNPFDCEDADPSVNPVSAEICDGTDNDCDLLADDADPSVTGRMLLFRDQDGDHFGSLPILTCDPLAGVTVDGDCQDLDAAIFPGATELCDQVDQDCDTQIDEGAAPQLTWWVDTDSDGFGASGPQNRVSCSRPAGYALSGVADCDDHDRTSWPGQAVEFCDTADNDCDGDVDDADLDTTLLAPFAFEDTDGDGYGAGAPVPLCALPPSGWSREGGDCDPDDPAVTPVQGCSGTGTGGAPTVLGSPGKWWHDDDTDGYGDFGRPAVLSSASPGATWSDNPLDCNDADGNDVYLAGVTSVAMLQTGLNNAPPCTVFVLPDGFDAQAALAFNTLAASKVRVASGGSSPAILRQTGNNKVFEFSGAFTSANAILHNLHLIGTSTTQWLVHVSSCSSTFGMADVELEGAPGLDASGSVKEDGDWYHGMPNVALDGTAIRSQYGSHEAIRVVVQDAPTTATHYAVNLTSSGTWTDLLVEGSGPVHAGATMGAPSLVDAEIRSSLHHALIVEATTGTPSLDGLVVTDAGDAGMLLQGGMPVSLRRVTIVGSAGNGVQSTLSFGGSLSDSIVWDSGGVDLFSSVVGGLSASTVMFATKSAVSGQAVAGPPGFVTWDPALDPAAWDLHLRATSPAKGAGTGGDDLGAYRAIDPWYDDTDADQLPDGWELQYLGTLSEGRTTDHDGDTRTNAQEYSAGTDPTLPDTDGDAFFDGVDGLPLDPRVH